MSLRAAPAVLLHDLTVAYDRKPAVHHLSGSFPAGSLTAVVGPNGAGKSTLLKTIVGLLRPTEGRVELRPPSARSSSGSMAAAVAYLPQQAEIDRSFPISVLDTVLLGYWRHLGWRREVTAAMHEAAQAAIAAVGLEGLAQAAVGTLSVGQFQRVLFARIVLQDAPVILLDEPFAAIDEATAADLVAVVEGWHREGRTVIAVLHDLGQVRAHFPQTLLLAGAAVAWGPTAEALTPDNLRRARRQADPWGADELIERMAS